MIYRMKKFFNNKVLTFVLSAVLGLLFINLIAPTVNAQVPEQIVLSTELERREHQLAKNLRCLVCQNQSIAESGAGLADDLKAEIRLQLSLGKSDKEIVQHMVDRYGEFINYKPAFNMNTLLLWLGPAIILLLMLVFLVRSINKQAKGLGMDDSESAD